VESSPSQLESGPVTADLTTTVVHSYKLLMNDIKPALTRSYLQKLMKKQLAAEKTK